ncbi:MAG: hypothetical protein JW819_01210, partial [Candidatus Krumholzibacteriota bacterium]|nr:hypothetical protein [Candidatus Krumholzibacteriota bacterium]
MNESVFIVSREPALLEPVREWGQLEDAPLLLFDTLQDAYGQLEAYTPLILIVDRRSESGSVLGLLRKARRRFPQLEIILIESERSPRVREAERQAGVDR